MSHTEESCSKVFTCVGPCPVSCDLDLACCLWLWSFPQQYWCHFPVFLLGMSRLIFVSFCTSFPYFICLCFSQILMCNISKLFLSFYSVYLHIHENLFSTAYFTHLWFSSIKMCVDEAFVFWMFVMSPYLGCVCVCFLDMAAFAEKSSFAQTQSLHIMVLQ